VWYHRPVEQRQTPGPRPKPIPEHVRERIKELAGTYRRVAGDPLGSPAP
jgi:hypothetical protein